MNKFEYHIKMQNNGNMKSFISKGPSRFIKTGDIDRFCDKVICQIEEFRKNCKRIEKED